MAHEKLLPKSDNSVSWMFQVHITHNGIHHSSLFPSFKITHLWLALLCMTCFHMSYEITLMCTSVGAKRTNKRLFPSMFADVYGEFGFTDGLVTANLALIISSAPFL